MLSRRKTLKTVLFSLSFSKVVLLLNFMIPPFDLKSFHFLGMINICNLVTRASHGPAIVGCSWLKKRHVLVALLTKLHEFTGTLVIMP